jgi:general secretion pathway protein G
MNNAEQLRTRNSDGMQSTGRRAFPRGGIRRGCGGFTLLELLVVIVIIGLLAGYVGPRYFSQVGKSEIQVARAQIDALEKALDQYRLDTHRYPSAEEGLSVLTAKPTSVANWNGPYLKKSVPNDPWGQPYVYRTPGQRGEFDLISYGRDGKPGGTGQEADIGNW